MTDTLAHTHARTQTHVRSPSPGPGTAVSPRRRGQSPDHGSRAAAAYPRRTAPDLERGGPRPAGMGKRAGEGAAGSASAASTSAVAGLEPAAGRGGGPRSAAAGLLGALHLVMTLVVAAARAEKEGGCQPAGISRARPRGCHRALAEAAAGLRPGRKGRGSRLGGRPGAGLGPARSCSADSRPEPGTRSSDANLRL